ncbi:hypothetical protein D3C80_1623850 [compost metagenome]
MSFSCGTERNNDPFLPFFEIRLIKIFYNGRIKKSCRFYGIFHGAVGTYQHFSLLREAIVVDLHSFYYSLNVFTMSIKYA